MNSLNVLISKGDGTFAAGVSYPLDVIGNQAARSLLVGDLNGDGRADAVVGNVEQNSIQGFLNQGDGSLVALPQGSQNIGCRPSYMALHDLSGDGRPDLVIACTYPNEVRVFKNDGPAQSLSFATPYSHQWTTATSQNNPPVPTGLAVGELNGDGLPDIAVATDSDLRILNSPKEAGRDYKDYLVSTPLAVRPSAVRTGDVNGNGVTDISALISGGGTSVQVFEYATGGTYNQLAVYQNLGVSGRTTSQTLGLSDMSSDGKSDFVLTLSNPSEVKVVVSRGETGLVAQPVTLYYQYPTGVQTCDGCLSLGDVSGDSRSDVVLRNGNKISVLISASR